MGAVEALEVLPAPRAASGVTQHTEGEKARDERSHGSDERWAGLRGDP